MPDKAGRIITPEEMEKIKREQSGVYGKRASMYDKLLNRIDELSEPGQVAFFEGKIKKNTAEGEKFVPISYQRAQSLKERTKQYLSDREFEFEFMENEEVSESFADDDGEGKTAYNVFCRLKE